MTPTQEISTHMAQDVIWAKFQPDNYAKYHRNVADAKKRAEQYKEKK